MSSNDNIIREKLIAIRHMLLEMDVDAWLIAAREDSDPILPYILTGHLVMDSAFLFTADDNTAILGHIDITNGQGSFFDRMIEYSPGTLEEALAPLLDSMNPTVLAVNYSEFDHTADGLTHGFYRRLEAAMGSEWLRSRAISAEDIVADLRGIKSSGELEVLQEAAEITVAIAEQIGQHIRPGISHHELRDLFERLVAADGRGQPEFFIPTSGCIGEILRGRPEYRVRIGDSLILDMGVRYKGFTSDYKRMWYFLRPSETDAPDDLHRAFNACRDVIQETSQALQVGRQGHEVDALARKRLAELGYEEFKHALGHQVGRLVHDGGVALGPLAQYRRSRTSIKSNMVFTLDPAIRTPTHYPASVEEQAWVQVEGPSKFLVPPQEHLWLVGNGGRVG